MKKLSKLLSLLLALLMVVALVPTFAYAVDEDEAAAEVEALDVGELLKDGVPCYGVYVKTPMDLPASGAEVVLTEQARLLDGTVGVGKSYVYKANMLGLVLIPKHLTGTYTLTATWQSTLLNIKHISLPGLTWSVSIAPDLDVITVYPIPDIKLNYTDHVRYIKGYPDGTVRPNGCLTRAEAAAMLYRIIKPSEFKGNETSNFADVKGHWAEKEINALASKGIINGTSPTTFDPDATILRQDLFTMVGRMFTREVTTDGLIGDTFVDLGEGYYAPFIRLLYTLGLVKGDANANTVRPADKITRAETAALLNRLLLRSPDKDSSNACEGVIHWPDCSPSDWFYADVMEASNTHNYTLELKVLTLDKHFAEIWTSTNNK